MYILRRSYKPQILVSFIQNDVVYNAGVVHLDQRKYDVLKW